ncbi:MAG: alpha/beta fold hydrolase [Sphingomonadales bacterium]|nr:MAG: alpha/beta fold hydrolase [Sphingomonadales bacterium]
MLFSRRAIVAAMLSAPLLPNMACAADEAGVPPFDRELRVPVQGGRIYVRVNGDLGSPRTPLLLVHGGPGAALWQLFPSLPLAKDRAIILYDQLDSGRSDAPGDTANWTVDRFVSEIAAIRAALGIERLHILGHSWGGIVANRYAASQPVGLKSLILQGTPLSAKRAIEGLRQLAAQLPPEEAAIMAARQSGGQSKIDPAAYQKAVGMMMRRHIARTSVRDVALPYMAPTPEDRGEAVGNALIGSDLFGAGFEGVLAGFDDEALLSRISVPTLLLRGEFDIVTADATKALLPLLKDGTYAEISGAGHMAQFDQPDAWRNVLSRFVTRHD